MEADAEEAADGASVDVVVASLPLLPMLTATRALSSSSLEMTMLLSISLIRTASAPLVRLRRFAREVVDSVG